VSNWERSDANLINDHADLCSARAGACGPLLRLVDAELARLPMPDLRSCFVRFVGELCPLECAIKRKIGEPFVLFSRWVEMLQEDNPHYTGAMYFENMQICKYEKMNR
jgi:hypothetical protein